MNNTVSHPSLSDANKMWALAKKSSLDTNSSYSYLMMCKFFRDRCFVLKNSKDDLLGFVTGFILKDDIYFVWQICIDSDYRGKGLAKYLLSRAIETLIGREGVQLVQATISPDNTSSMRLFESMASEYGTFFASKRGFEEVDFPDEKPAELLVQVGPLNLKY